MTSTDAPQPDPKEPATASGSATAAANAEPTGHNDVPASAPAADSAEPVQPSDPVEPAEPSQPQQQEPKQPAETDEQATHRIRNERAAKLPANLSRSWLLVNAAKPEQFEPALLSEADSVIFDLEAAVAEDRKEEARYYVVRALNSGLSAWVRINGMDTHHWKTDLEALIKTPGLRGVMLAQTEKPEQVTLTAMRLHAGTPVIALIESAIGVENATAIASAPGTFRLAFGVNDFRKDTGATEDPMALAYARGKLVVASRVGKLPGPIDGPPAATDSVEAVLAACDITQRMGMTGKMCLTVGQVEDVNRGLSPSTEELQWARELITQHEQAQRSNGVDIADGSYLPRLARAQKVANLADTYGLWKN